MILQRVKFNFFGEKVGVKTAINGGSALIKVVQNDVK